ncbi:hypothetical protein GCM10022630_10040 [Thermobifida alba]
MVPATDTAPDGTDPFRPVGALPAATGSSPVVQGPFEPAVRESPGPPAFFRSRRPGPAGTARLRFLRPAPHRANFALDDSPKKCDIYYLKLFSLSMGALPKGGSTTSHR